MANKLLLIRSIIIEKTLFTKYNHHKRKQLCFRDLHGLVINSPTIQRNQTPPPPHPAQGHPAVVKVKGQINWYFRIRSLCLDYYEQYILISCYEIESI